MRLPDGVLMRLVVGRCYAVEAREIGLAAKCLPFTHEDLRPHLKKKTCALSSWEAQTSGSLGLLGHPIQPNWKILQ